MVVKSDASDSTLKNKLPLAIKWRTRPEQYPRRAVVFLALLWLLIQSAMLWYLGIRSGSDTEVYVNAAHALLEGHFPEGRLLWYSSYIVLLAAIFKLGGGLAQVVAVQIFLSGLAAIFLWGATDRLTKDARISCLSVFLYLAWFKIHQWNIFIYTESVFTSLAIIAFSSWVLSRKWWHYGLSTLFIIITFFTRPTGFSFVAGWLIFGLATLPFNTRLKWAVAAIGLCISLLLLHFMLKDFVLIESYAKAEIIYPNISLGIRPPDELYIPAEERSTLERLLLFASCNPVYFVKISMIKLLLFFGNVKPYFSVLHNLLIVLLLYPLYYFAVRGYRNFPAQRPEKYFILGFILAQACTVMLTSENWDGRFLVPVLPFIFVLSAAGLNHTFNKKASPITERGSNRI